MSKDTTKTKKTRQAAEKASKKPIEGENIDYAVTTAKLSDLIPDDKNFNRGTEFGQHLIEKSLRENGAGRSILLDKNNRIIAGNKTTENAATIDMDDVIIVETDGTKLVAVKRTDIDLDSEQGRRMALADNATSAANLEWDEEQLRAMQAEMDNFDPEEWGVKFDLEDSDVSEDEEIERKKKEFEERMQAGEDLSEDDEYKDFLEKFKNKKTTDDCYTPEIVYDAVARWVMDEYGVNKKDFERPFYPKGDYKKHIYPKGCIVVDNPPFSILAEILSFYHEKNIKFFLFAPTLTLFSSSSSSCAIPIAATVVYENGANVNTSFLTNLEDPSLRLRSAPSLYKAVTEAVECDQKQKRKELPKYTYPDNVITSSFVARLSRYGIDFRITKSESLSISKLDSQKKAKKQIYGKGYLVGEKAAAEKAAAEKWELSEREKKIIKTLK
ncbi:MAG: hypothetical protein IKJ81_09670 [Bacteroidales bacterium]|nr:hypothetical protein [Bacteroidales bacterium]